MIEEKGRIKFCEANDINIPVNIWLVETVDENTREKDGTWSLLAQNYMPRVNVVEDGFEAVSSSREELVALIKQFILPLYEVAVTKLNDICEGKDDNLFFWDL